MSQKSCARWFERFGNGGGSWKKLKKHSRLADWQAYSSRPADWQTLQEIIDIPLRFLAGSGTVADFLEGGRKR